MKKILFSLSLIALIGIGVANAQVNVGSSSAPESSAALQISSTDKGFRLPQVSLTNTTTYLSSGTASEATVGMQVYNTNAAITGSTSYPAQGAGVYTWGGNGWEASSKAGDNIVFMSGNGPQRIVNNNTSIYLDLGTTYKINDDYVNRQSGVTAKIKIAGLYLVEWNGYFDYKFAASIGGTAYMSVAGSGGYVALPVTPNGSIGSGSSLPISGRQVAYFSAGASIESQAYDYNSVNGNAFHLGTLTITRFQ